MLIITIIIVVTPVLFIAENRIIRLQAQKQEDYKPLPAKSETGKATRQGKFKFKQKKAKIEEGCCRKRLGFIAKYLKSKFKLFVYHIYMF